MNNEAFRKVEVKRFSPSGNLLGSYEVPTTYIFTTGFTVGPDTNFDTNFQFYITNFTNTGKVKTTGHDVRSFSEHFYRQSWLKTTCRVLSDTFASHCKVARVAVSTVFSELS